MSKKVIIVTGMSGAGRSTAIGILEDMGFYCVEHIPCEMIDSFISVIENNRFKKLAMSIALGDIECVMNRFDAKQIDYAVIFLTADKREIIKRYKLTKHIHPLIISGQALTLDDAIDAEVSMAAVIEQIKDVQIIHTDEINQYGLAEIIRNRFGDAEHRMTVVFEAFGFKIGVPKDVDLVFDVRFLPNPFWVEDLRELSGDDQPVYDYVMNSEAGKDFIPYLDGFLDKMFEIYVKENKNYVIVAVGCTGGRHRLLSVVNYLFNRYKGKYRCFKKSQN